MSEYKTLKQINENPIYAPIGCEEEFKRRIFLDNFQRCMNIRTFQKTAGIIIKKKITGIHPLAKIMQKPIRSYHEHLTEYTYENIQVDNNLDELEANYTAVYKSFYNYYKGESLDHQKISPCKKYVCYTDWYGIDEYKNKKDKENNKTWTSVSTRVKRFHKVRQFWHKLTKIDRGYRNFLDHENPATFRYYSELINPDIVDGFLRIGYVKFMQLFMNWIINVRVSGSSKGLMFDEMWRDQPQIIGGYELISNYDIIDLVKNENFSKLHPLKDL